MTAPGAHTTGWPDTPLDAVDAAFAKLTCHPDPLSLDLDPIAGEFGDNSEVPRGVMALPALDRWLEEHRRAYTVRDAVWRELIRRARLDGPVWVIAATALALPALRRYAGQLRTGWSGDAHDLDAEILTGFLTALRDRVDLSRPAPHAALCKAAWRAGYQLRQRDGAQPIPVQDVEYVTGPRTPKRPYGHPDLLVRRAVQLGIVDADDEQPYIDLRLGRRAVEPIAARLGLPADTLRRRVQRIDTRIAQALCAGMLTDVTSPKTRKALAEAATTRQRIRAARGNGSTPTAIASHPGQAAA
jgi:DNA-directed RNA polymerase specialized sigma24 family protein